jgi:DNA-binding transcriptional MerR regulator
MWSGELARRAGVSAATIRHYERLGLLKTLARTEGGYRNYPPESLDRMTVIRRALGVGFSLKELSQFRGSEIAVACRARQSSQARDQNLSRSTGKSTN